MSEKRTYPEKPLLGVSAAIWRDGKVLLVKRAKNPLLGYWSLPGGLVHTGERLHDAIVREIAEETGITAKFSGIADLVEVIRRDEAGKPAHHYVVAVFAGVWHQGDAIAMDDAAAIKWAYPERLSSLTLTPETEQVFLKTKDFLKNKKPGLTNLTSL